MRLEDISFLLEETWADLLLRKRKESSGEEEMINGARIRRRVGGDGIKRKKHRGQS